jgi:hypothetical protein
MDGERLAVRREPFVAAFGKAGAFQQVRRGLWVRFPPPAAERGGDLLGVGGDLFAQRRPQLLGDPRADRRVVRLDGALT